MQRLLLARLLEQRVPHALHQSLITRVEFTGLNGFIEATAHALVDGPRGVIVTRFQLGYRQRQVTTQITAGKQLIVTGVLNHAIN